MHLYYLNLIYFVEIQKIIFLNHGFDLIFVLEILLISLYEYLIHFVYLNSLFLNHLFHFHNLLILILIIVLILKFFFHILLLILCFFDFPFLISFFLIHAQSYFLQFYFLNFHFQFFDLIIQILIFH